jgi:hypothetical protein
MRKVSILSFCILMSVAAAAQEVKKPLSPPAKAEATIAGKKLTIDYSAPSRRDRKIMGQLVPYGQVWRTGANAATKLVTEGDLLIGGLHVPPGTYTLYTLPGGPSGPSSSTSRPASGARTTSRLRISAG